MISKQDFPVDSMVPSEYERNVTEDLLRWQTLEGANSTTWTVGDNDEGRKLIFDGPAKALGFGSELGLAIRVGRSDSAIIARVASYTATSERHPRLRRRAVGWLRAVGNQGIPKIARRLKSRTAARALEGKDQ